MSENKICKFFEYNGAKVPSIGLGTAFMTSDIAEVDTHQLRMVPD